MIKYLFILIHSLSLFLYSLFSGDNPITVSNNIPKTIAPGQEVPIELKVTKGSMSGFAKLQIELPDGLTLKEMDNKGANYSLTDGIAKWVWSSLPTDEELVVKCILVAESSATGAKTIGGKYSYVENNGKVVVEMAPAEISIGEAAAVNNETPAQPANTESTTPANSTSGETNTSVTQSQPTVTPANTNSEPSGNITIQRSISKGSAEGEYLVDIRISKGITKGFARYSDDMPADLSAKPGRTMGSSFSVSDGKLKFVWVNVPDNEVLEISYTLSGVTKPIVLNGEYSYLEQNQSKVQNAQPETLTPTGGEQVAVNTNTVPAETNTTTPVETNTGSAVDTNTGSTAATNTTGTDTSTPSETLPKKEGNVNYMVQIGAFTNSAVNAGKLSRKFSISENIKSEMQGGFSKFMVGSHGEYKAARDHREKIRNGNRVNSAFVVAYNTGKRITVQEALMISNQKWFK
jgi:hypothetical protein